jgi:hypothetical protein
MEIWNGIEIYGYDYKRMITYLKTLNEEYLDNLQSCTAAKGHCSFVWRFEEQKHITDGIDIPACEDWPYGDYWSIDNEFMNFKMSDCDKDLIRFDTMLGELRGQSLSNAIDYWCIANDISTDWDLYLKCEAIINENHKAIVKKIAELNELLKNCL